MALAGIATSIGNFDVMNNGHNGTILYYGGKEVAEFNNVSWWNVDSILNAVENRKKEIQERMRKNAINGITKENAAEVMEKLVEVLGGEDKGFYSSRLKQCINRLNTPKTGVNELYT